MTVGGGRIDVPRGTKKRKERKSALFKHITYRFINQIISWYCSADNSESNSPES